MKRIILTIALNGLFSISGKEKEIEKV